MIELENKDLEASAGKDAVGILSEKQNEAVLRTVFVLRQDAAFRVGRDNWAAERMRPRDVSLLATLAQHHWLTAEQLYALYFPSENRGRQRLRRLTREMHVLARWRQLEPHGNGWRRHSDVVLLAERGAAVLAQRTDRDPGAEIRRAHRASVNTVRAHHALEVNGFFASLVAASRDLPDQGLYRWLSDDSARAQLRQHPAPQARSLVPDGSGRYLLPDREIVFYVEWDRGYAGQERIANKAKAYMAAFPSGNSRILFVGPGPAREAALANVIRQAVSARNHPRFLTSNMALLASEGPLGRVWSPVAGGGRRSLVDLPGSERSELVVTDCIGKAGWWERRAPGTEGE